MSTLVYTLYVHRYLEIYLTNGTPWLKNISTRLLGTVYSILTGCCGLRLYIERAHHPTMHKRGIFNWLCIQISWKFIPYAYVNKFSFVHLSYLSSLRSFLFENGKHVNSLSLYIDLKCFKALSVCFCNNLISQKTLFVDKYLTKDLLWSFSLLFSVVDSKALARQLPK